MCLNFRDSVGGTICIFKFGIATDPLMRWGFYRADGYERMVVILMSAKVGGVELLEAHLISKHGHIMGCRLVALGGEGILGRFPSYFVYIVGPELTELSGLRKKEHMFSAKML
jgi:hypothetical protein